jgi:protein-S-isoprenylcysteine O-methyltransferase Ste14
MKLDEQQSNLNKDYMISENKNIKYDLNIIFKYLDISKDFGLEDYKRPDKITTFGVFCNILKVFWKVISTITIKPFSKRYRKLLLLFLGFWFFYFVSEHFKTTRNVFWFCFLMMCLFIVFIIISLISFAIKNHGDSERSNILKNKKITYRFINNSTHLYFHGKEAKQSLRMAKYLLEERISSLSLQKELVPDFVPIVVGLVAICVGVLFFSPSSISSTIVSNLPIISAVMACIFIVVKYYMIDNLNSKIKNSRRCLITINQVIDKIEEDETLAKTTAACKVIEQHQTL